MAKILWLTEPAGLSDPQKIVLNGLLQKEKISLSQIMFVSLERDKELGLEQALDKYIAICKPELLVINSPEALKIFNPTLMKAVKRAATGLGLCRGSVYEYKGLSALAIDSLRTMYISPVGRWYFTNDIQKLGRWVQGKQRQQPKFAYKVCHSIHDLQESLDFARSCICISRDIETHGGQITVDGFSGLKSDGTVFTYVIPFYNPLKNENRHWTFEDECFAWQIVRDINACQAAKILQNGAYDSAYYISYGVPLANYTIDTMHLFHSIWTEAPKKLNIISSICLDYCRYWKDEAKGDAKKKGSVRFKTQDDLDKYWRYNALDCYNTLCNARVLTAVIGKLDWALRNYATEFALQVGPALTISMRGLKVNEERLDQKQAKLEYEYKKNLAELRTMADDPGFNPNSPQQYAHLLYKVLGARMPVLRGKAATKLKEFSTDTTVLKMIALQHPLIEAFIKKIWATKRPRNNISKYCGGGKKPRDKIFWRGAHGLRFIFNYNAAGTETGRGACGQHQFWVGTNAQNVPGRMRDFAEADPGYVFFEPDLSQSDARYVAYESQDPVYIANVESGKDTHCLHASHFFRPMTFDEIYKSYKAGDPFFADDVTGIRAITKKIVHGKNYNMGGFTLYMLMGRKAVIAAATAKGFKGAEGWDDKRICTFCQSLLDDYDKMYTRLAPWQKEEHAKGAANGNKITVAYGRTRLFFGDLRNDKAAQREATAYFGQGGTAGNINRTMLHTYYRGLDDNKNVILVSQTHDSLLFMLKEENFHELAKQILTVMEAPVMIHGRSLSVPAEGKAGYNWGMGLVKYNPTLTLADLRKQADKLTAEHLDLLKEIGGKDEGEETDDDESEDEDNLAEA